MFERDYEGFDAQIISIGSFIDRDQEPRLYQVDCMVLRLNPAALDGYNKAHLCFAEGYGCCDMQKQEEARMKRDASIARWEREMRAIIGLEDEAVGVNFAQITAEVFGVTWIREITGSADES